VHNLTKQKVKKIFILTLLSFFGCKNQPICTVNENNAGKQIYDLDEATCFIALKLNKKKSDLDKVRKALIAEENYMVKIGLISEGPNPENETEPSPVLDIERMAEYARKEEKVELSKNELLDIYDIEVEYLKFIGVVTE
jgi:ssDNA-binding Zn-finger/Zn-ribbon topoisomerase 1